MATCKGKMEEDLFQFSLPIEVLITLPPGFNDVFDEGEKVQDEGVPHEVEGGGRPVSVPILKQVKEGDAVGCDVCEG